MWQRFGLKGVNITSKILRLFDLKDYKDYYLSFGELMALSYEDLHKLFCPAENWHDAFKNANTPELRAECLLAFTEYCKCVERAAKAEIRAYAYKVQGETDERRILLGKMRI
jgi:hypothetical protein